jgi:hypothetical protein
MFAVMFPARGLSRLLRDRPSRPATTTAWARKPEQEQPTPPRPRRLACQPQAALRTVRISSACARAPMSHTPAPRVRIALREEAADEESASGSGTGYCPGLGCQCWRRPCWSLRLAGGDRPRPRLNAPILHRCWASSAPRRPIGSRTLRSRVRRSTRGHHLLSDWAGTTSRCRLGTRRRRNGAARLWGAVGPRPSTGRSRGAVVRQAGSGPVRGLLLPWRSGPFQPPDCRRPGRGPHPPRTKRHHP